MIAKSLNSHVIFMLHMSQKDYNMEILLQLLKGPKHIRALARDLNTNQTTIARKVKELEHVIEHKTVGKNKVVSIRRNFVGKQYALMAEHYKLLMLIDRHPEFSVLFAEMDAEMVILFGSYAKGLEKKNSDIDIYLETTSKELKNKVESLNSRVRVKIGDFDQNSLLIKEIIKDHVIIKGGERFYEEVFK